MKTRERIAALAVLVFFSLVILGCGVSTEEHEKTLSELNRVTIELQQARAEIADLKAQLAAERAGDGFEKQYREARERLGELAASFQSVTRENAALKGEMDKLQALIADLQDQVRLFQEKAKDLPADLLRRR